MPDFKILKKINSQWLESLRYDDYRCRLYLYDLIWTRAGTLSGRNISQTVAIEFKAHVRAFHVASS